MEEHRLAFEAEYLRFATKMWADLGISADQVAIDFSRGYEGLYSYAPSELSWIGFQLVRDHQAVLSNQPSHEAGTCYCVSRMRCRAEQRDVGTSKRK